MSNNQSTLPEDIDNLLFKTLWVYRGMLDSNQLKWSDQSAASTDVWLYAKN